MARTDNEDIQRTLGSIEKAIEMLSAAVENQGKDSKESRSKIYNAIDDIRMTSQKVDHRVSSLEEKVSAITPTTVEFNRWKSRAEGAGWVGKFLWLAGGVILGVASWVAGIFHMQVPK